MMKNNFNILQLLNILCVCFFFFCCNNSQPSTSNNAVKKVQIPYVDRIQEKLELTDIEKERVKIAIKSYNLAQENAKNLVHLEHLQDLRRKTFISIIGEEKYEILLELKREGEL